MEMGDAPTVRVLSASRVSPAASQQQHGGGGGGGGGGRVKLSYLDVSWICLPAVQQLFLYEYDLALGDDRDDDFPAAVVSRLKAALADTLKHYLPWAGRLQYEADTGDLVVDCSEAGVSFVEADADGMDVRRLAYDEVHDMAAFVSLVPELDARVLPAPVLSVQVTQLGLGACGGLAVGLSMHHALADGRAMWRFMEAWAASSRGVEGSPGIVSPPIYCRDAVHYLRAEELAREWLKIHASNLPVVSSRERDLTSPLLRLARRTFHLGTDGIRTLKRRIDDLATAAATATGTPNPKPVCTFVALASLGWTAFVRSKGLGAGDDTYLTFLADLRARLDPPVTDAYLGNCIRICVARCTDAAEIAGEIGILNAARAVQAAVAELAAGPLLSYDEALSDMVSQLPSSRLTNMVGSPWFQAYEGADFGFGKPVLSEAVSMNRDGEMMLLGGRQDGEIQVSVSIDPAHMATYKACILCYLPSLSPN